jgi:hypothetical protein
MNGLHGVFYLSAAMCLIAAIASLLRGKRYVYEQEPGEDASTTTIAEEAKKEGAVSD